MDDLDAIKSNPGVIRIYSQFVKSLKKTGDKYVGLCPIHGEKSPSFTVFPDMRFNCFGCQAAGNIFQFLEKVDGCDFKTAVERVKKELGGWFEAKEKVESVFHPVSEPKVYKTIELEKWQKLEDALTHSEAGLKWLSSERGIGPGTAPGRCSPVLNNRFFINRNLIRDLLVFHQRTFFVVGMVSQYLRDLVYGRSHVKIRSK